MGTGGPFPVGKQRPERDTDNSPPSSVEVKNEYEPYFLPPPPPGACMAEADSFTYSRIGGFWEHREKL
jgi:hypothetical protein